jgi:hypothetical protein
MEFLDMNLTKDPSFCSILFTVSSTGGFYRKPGSTLPFKLHTKNGKTRQLESIDEYHFVEPKKRGWKPDKNSSLRRLKKTQKPWLNMPLKNFISVWTWIWWGRSLDCPLWIISFFGAGMVQEFFAWTLKSSDWYISYSILQLSGPRTSWKYIYI